LRIIGKFFKTTTMEAIGRTMERSGIRVGLLTFTALVGYFFLMKIAGLAHILELRVFNFVFMAIGICIGIVRLKRQLHPNDFYLRGLGQGLITGATAVISFALFMSIYLSFFDRALLYTIMEQAPMGWSVNGTSIFVILLMEGMVSAFIISFVAMQYFKTVKKGE